MDNQQFTAWKIIEDWGNEQNIAMSAADMLILRDIFAAALRQAAEAEREEQRKDIMDAVRRLSWLVSHVREQYKLEEHPSITYWGDVEDTAIHLAAAIRARGKP